jgi:hypothetical protein
VSIQRTVEVQKNSPFRKLRPKISDAIMHSLQFFSRSGVLPASERRVCYRGKLGSHQKPFEELGRFSALNLNLADCRQSAKLHLTGYGCQAFFKRLSFPDWNIKLS